MSLSENSSASLSIPSFLGLALVERVSSQKVRVIAAGFRLSPESSEYSQNIIYPNLLMTYSPCQPDLCPCLKLELEDHAKSNHVLMINSVFPWLTTIIFILPTGLDAAPAQMDIVELPAYQGIPGP